MVQLILINSGTYRPGVNQIGDLVQVVEDIVKFTLDATALNQQACGDADVKMGTPLLDSRKTYIKEI